MRCIVCKTEMNNLDQAGAQKGIQPCEGLEFTSHGHFGSTAFDPMDGTFLSVVICDDCLKEESKSGEVHVGKLTPSRRAEYEPWEADA